MRLNDYDNRHDLLFDWMLGVVPRGGTFLDVGANDGGFCPEVKRVAEHAGALAGVDPDVGRLRGNPFLTERFEGKLEEADVPREAFDCVYAIYVLEHVEHPLRFLAAAHQALRPGGSFFFITPNGLHYFAAVARLLGSCGVQGRVLRLLRPATLVEGYHYPAVYRCNTPTRIREMARAVGFERSDFRFAERLDELTPYFPGPSRVFPWLWERAAGAARRPELLCNLMGRLVK